MKKSVIITLTTIFCYLYAEEVRFKVLSPLVSIKLEQDVVDLGEVNVGETKVSTSCMIIKNDGETTVDLEVYYSTGSFTQTLDFKLYTLFKLNPSTPTENEFEEIFSTPTYKYNNLPFSRERYVYFMFKPYSISTSSLTLEIPVIFKATPAKTKEVSKKIGILGGEVSFYDGTKIIVPQGALDKEINISIKEISKYDVPKKGDEIPVVCYKFEPEGVVFKKPIDIYLLYPYKEGMKEEELKIFVYDGFVWRVLGGIVDKEKKYVYAKTNHFSYYAVFLQKTISKEDIKPKEKIITPNNDNKNDFVFFGGISDKNFVIKIFDIKGRKIKTITQKDGPYWYGKDEQGSVVESGVYIYEVEVDNQRYYGTITVAK